VEYFSDIGKNALGIDNSERNRPVFRERGDLLPGLRGAVMEETSRYRSVSLPRALIPFLRSFTAKKAAERI
jgi:hypothetical protein